MGGGHTVRVDVVSVGQAVGSLDDLLLQGMGVAWDGKGHAAVGVGASLCFEVLVRVERLETEGLTRGLLLQTVENAAGGRLRAEWRDALWMTRQGCCRRLMQSPSYTTCAAGVR